VGGIHALVEERSRTGDQQLDRILDPGHARRDRRDDLGLHLLVDRAEERALVGEVVVQRAARELRAVDDLLGADAGVAALGEQLTGDAHELRARRLRSLGLAALRLHPRDNLALPVDIHAACRLHTVCR
jgi:hypothetical protein